MKAQQILNSFLPGVTVAVLTTQPTWAGTMTVDNSHLGIYKSIFATSSRSSDVSPSTILIVNNTIDNKYPAPFTPVRIAKGNLKPAIFSNSEVRVAGKTGALIKTNGQNQPLKKTARNALKTASHRSLAQALKKPSLQNVSSGNVDLTQTKKIAPAVIKKNPDDKIFQKLQHISKAPGAAKLLEVESCPTQEDALKLQNLLSASATSACQRINSIPNHHKLAQPLSPAPVQPIRPPLRGPAPIPNSLDPSANPLQYPTKPEEVRVEQTQPITLQQALELARRNNQELQVALLQLERAQAGLKVAQAALLPTVGLNAQVARQQSATGQLSNELQDDIPPELRNSQDDSPSTAFSGGAQLNYDIYTSGARSARIRQAEEQVRLQELDVERLSEEIRLNVATEYYNLQQSDEQVRISQAAVVNAEASLRDARALEEAGVGTRFDSLRTQVNLANAQQTLTNARSQQRIARRQLVTRLNLAQSATVTAADPVRLSGLWNQTLENSIVLAYQNRPELQQQLAQRNINEQQRRQALSQLGPQVSLVANYELLDRFNDSAGLTDGYSIALRANLNLFDGGASRAQAAQAKADIQIAETQFSQQRNQIRFEVERAYSELQSNLENVQTSEAALNQARESLRLARLRFQAGVGTQLEVIDAENALTQAEGNRINAILDYNRALANLQRSVTSRGLR
ncbi:TolC family protein [Plectonema cf. radiosum LEGE 06105]|uniref:TolC family protein n=1 Tax=Plectonema cf. radiosum LEGE 06105 TaxID=945769 RepID=A0A8J7F5X6_9CYAN|nr:TolC family protein [Plectonema radiosum]MBE9215940.1 TolC family protein [Plectonema cf. radiosum LEGE 06105]